jgi:hypothetical protein
MKDTKKSARSTTASDKTYEGFTDEERAAMKERARELKASRGTVFQQGSWPWSKKCSPAGGYQAPSLPDGDSLTLIRSRAPRPACGQGGRGKRCAREDR